MNLKVKGYNNDGWFTKEELHDKTLEDDEKLFAVIPTIPALEDDEEEEVKEGNKTKMLNLKQTIN